MTRNLIFSRKASLRGVAMKYIIILDGKEVGRLGSGQTLKFSVAEGYHTLTLKPYPGFMLQTFGQYDVIVGKRDVNVWVDTSQNAFVCKITGSENESQFSEKLKSMCLKLIDLTAQEAVRNLPCYYIMEKDRVALKAKSGNRTLMNVYYSELSDYAVIKLESWEQPEMAKEFGVELSLSGRANGAWIHVGGIGVNLD